MSKINYYLCVKLNAGSSVWVIGEWAAKPKTPGGEVEEERVGSPAARSFDHLCQRSKGRGGWVKDENGNVEADERTLGGEGDGTRKFRMERNDESVCGSMYRKGKRVWAESFSGRMCSDRLVEYSGCRTGGMS
ncbi:hypothetical protein P691DRAFT_790460 [Macrolepiota fuliginosa MF-IS2]|uniref:Uncharacterized protein n=1 Tax=Macrolepiota fuliginosa MF-IS2 TaxID=1400762 RepID=A0A9P5XGG9_9AGAR|nr:hypothetical protein P691DRAFT_790460 [Macrolepiota fuliginosa MF-IS2]